MSPYTLHRYLFCVLFLQAHLFPLSGGVVTLTSSVQGGICPREEVILTCTVTGGVSLEWSSTAFSPMVRFVGNDPVGQPIDRGIFTATLISALTSTLRVTATPEAMLNGTVVTCSDQLNPMSITLTLADLPSLPQNPGYRVHHYGPHNVTVTVQWGYPEFDGGVPVDNYTISGANITTTTSQINETTLTLPYNARQTIEVAATNCIGTSGTSMFTYFEANCGAPPPPVSGSVQPHNTTEGSVVVFQCDPGFVPEGEMTAVCGRDGQWTPNPGGVTCSPRPTFTETATPTETSTPGTAPTPQPWVVPVVVVCVCVLVLSCVVIIIIVGIIIVKRRQSRVAKKLDASDHLELRSPTMDEINEPSRSQGETTVIEAQYHVVQETSEKTTVVAAEYSSVVQISGQRTQVPGRLMYADLGPHTQAPVRPPSTADSVQYSSLLHGEAVQAPLDPADKSLNLDNLLIQLQHVDITKWYQLGEALGIPKRRLNDITFHHSAEPDQCKVEVLDYWLRNRTGPTWREVADALTQIHESELANSLREVYTTGILPVTVDMRSLPRSTFGDESPPPPLPPKQFSDDDPLPLLECHEPPRNVPPPRPPKAQQNKPPPKPTAPPRPPKGHQRGAPPRPPKPGQS